MGSVCLFRFSQRSQWSQCSSWPGDGTLILVAFLKHCLAPSPLVASPSVCSFLTLSHALILTWAFTLSSHVYAFSRVLTLHAHFPRSFSHILLLHTRSLVHSFSHVPTFSHSPSHTGLCPWSHPSMALDSFCPCLPLLRDRPAPSGLPTSPFPGSCFFAFASVLKPS